MFLLVSNGPPLRWRIGMAGRLGCGCARAVAQGAGRMENLSVRRGVAVASVVPVSLLVSMVRRVATRTVDCCLEHERQTFEFALALPASDGSPGSTTRGGS